VLLLLLLLLLRCCMHINRTDSSYARWEEALKAWNDVRSLSKDLARQVRVVDCCNICWLL
jgi:predicted membrane chloride channel (bestrophin family)